MDGNFRIGQRVVVSNHYGWPNNPTGTITVPEPDIPGSGWGTVYRTHRASVKKFGLIGLNLTSINKTLMEMDRM